MKQIKPWMFLLIYLLLIIIYATAYRLIPGAVVQPEFTFLKSIYFSSVTITTLGFGDITPKSDVAMLIVASEAILGIVIIGLFLSSLWQSFARQIEVQQENVLKNSVATQNLHRLAIFFKYLSVVISDCQISLAELTTPISKRHGLIDPNPSFIFSDLQDLYKPSMLTKSGFSKPVIHHYYEKLDMLAVELKFLLANFDLMDYQNIHNGVVDFLTLSRANDVREALYSYETIGSGGELMKDTLAGMIKEHEQCPDLETYKSNVITPAIILYQTVKFQIVQIKSLRAEFDKLVTNTPLEPRR